jgi:hypothetical protein
MLHKIYGHGLQVGLYPVCHGNGLKRRLGGQLLVFDLFDVVIVKTYRFRWSPFKSKRSGSARSRILVLNCKLFCSSYNVPSMIGASNSFGASFDPSGPGPGRVGPGRYSHDLAAGIAVSKDVRACSYILEPMIVQGGRRSGVKHLNRDECPSLICGTRRHSRPRESHRRCGAPLADHCSRARFASSKLCRHRLSSSKNPKRIVDHRWNIA